MVGNGDLTGSDRSHISVSYHDGSLDTSESMYFHKTFPLHEGWHSRYGHSTTIVAWNIRFGGFWYSFNHHAYLSLLLLRAQKLPTDSQVAQLAFVHHLRRISEDYKDSWSATY